MIDLSGHVAVVTGAGSGIGRATALVFARAGAAVAAVDLDGEAAERTAKEITACEGRSVALVTDITDDEQVAALPSSVDDALGRPTVLVNNVGWDVIEPFVENSADYWRRVVDVNFLGPVAVTRSLLDGMIEARRGAIVNVSSDAGRVGSSGETVYAGAKGGIIAFTKSLAREVARHGIRVNCVCPGPTDTPLFRSQPEKMKEALVRAIPFRRVGDPRDVAHMSAFFASDLATFVTGQVISVSGGLTMAG